MSAETQTASAEETAAATAAAATEQATTTTSESAAEGQQESQETNPDGTPKAKVTGGFQKRIDKLTREKEFWKEQALLGSRPAAAQQQQAAAQTETPKPATEGKPKANDFETHEEYVEALVDWKADQKLKVVQTENAKERVRSQEQTAHQTYQAKEKEYASAVPDFDEVVAAADFPVSKAVIDEIVTGDNGPALKYYLAQNPEEADRLNKLGPVALAREVGRLEPRFKMAAKTTAAAVSKAPAPVAAATRSTSTSTKDPGEMSPSEYRAWRQKTYPNLR
jgi:hypothetical protein